MPEIRDESGAVLTPSLTVVNPASRIPADAVEISDELWQSWLPHTHSKALKDGALVDVPQRTGLLSVEARCNRILAQTAHELAPDEPEARRAAWATFRAAIRAIRDAGTAPAQWPEPPKDSPK